MKETPNESGGNSQAQLDDDLEQVLDSVVLMMAKGTVKPTALQAVAKAVDQNNSGRRRSPDTVLDRVLTDYYSNLGYQPTGCSNCGPPGWHSMPAPNL